jgi:hypothetical protein
MFIINQSAMPKIIVNIPLLIISGIAKDLVSKVTSPYYSRQYHHL